MIGHNGTHYCCLLEEKEKKQTKDPRNSNRARNSGKSGTENRRPASSFLPFVSVCLYAHLSVDAQAHSAYENIFPKKSALLTFLVWPGEWEKSEGDEGGHGAQTKIPCEVVSLYEVGRKQTGLCVRVRVRGCGCVRGVCICVCVCERAHMYVAEQE